MKGVLIAGIFLLAAVSQISAQIAINGPGDATGVLGGIITTADGKPAGGVTVTLKGLNRSTLTDDDGQFSFRRLEPGSYTVEITFAGYEPIDRTVYVESGRPVRLDLQLKIPERQLDQVVVTNGYNKFNKKETDDIARLPLKNMENPQVYTVVTKEIMKEQLVTDYNSAFRSIPGAGVPIVYNQGRSALYSRGFVTENLVRNSVSGFVYTNIDPANLERLEAIKGPSGTLFNSSMISFGGLFNRVTKQPFDSRRGEIGYSGGGFDLNRLTVDFNQPLNDDKTALMRINGALHTEQSFQDAGFTRSYMVAPSFVYKASDRLSFLLDVEASSFNATSPVRFAPSATGKIHDVRDLGMGYRRSFANNTLDYTTKQVNVFGQINYQLSSQWRLQTLYTRTFSTTKGYVNQLIGKTDSTLSQQSQKEDFPYYGTNIQQNIVGDFFIGRLRNRLVAGVDIYNQKSEWTNTTVSMPAINFRHPGAAYNNFNSAKVDSAAARLPWVNYRTNQSTYGVYFSDVLNLTEKLNVMVSLRADLFDNKGTYYPGADSTAGAYSQHALSPKFGAVYQVVKDRVSLFGNYMNGFANVNGTDFGGGTFKPQQANQWEGGVKLDLLRHKVSATLSYYDIRVRNVTRDDLSHPGYSIQDGTQLSRGVEGEVIANPFAGFNIVAGYTYNDSRYTQANKSVQGLRPATAGPARLANLWMSYRIVGGKAKGLGLGFGGNYGSSSFQTNTATFAFTIPSYTVLNASVFYDQPSYRIGVKVDNLTNGKYWSYRLAPQNPVRVTANITFRF
ncbi:MAG: TonB-dependent receptor [Bacteroidetes bacterium]|nr:TonB-dependent receptor [Bacteroidota bacterium]